MRVLIVLSILGAFQPATAEEKAARPTPAMTYRYARQLLRQHALPEPIRKDVVAGMRIVLRGATAPGSSIEYSDKFRSAAFLEANGAKDEWHELSVSVGDRVDGHVIMGDPMKTIHWRFMPARSSGEQILLVDRNRGQRTWYRLKAGEVVEESAKELQ